MALNFPDSPSNGDAFEGAQVVVRGTNGSIPESEVVRYFVENFPNRQQMWTSEDGLWVAINIPVGDWIIEMWVYDEASSGHLLQGTTPVKVFANSINIANVVSGHDDGLLYPDNCLLSSGSEPAGEPAEEPRGEPSGEASSEPAEEPSGEPSGEVNTTDTLRVDHSKE